MPHFMAAIAQAHAAVLGGPDHLTGPLVIERMEGVLGRQHGLVDEGPAELGSPMPKRAVMKSSSTLMY